MRSIVVLAAFVLVVLALPAAAKAAECPGYVAAEALRDKAVDDKVHSSKLSGAKALDAIANLKKGTALAERCTSTGSPSARAAALAVAAQLRWNQACVLSYDGIKADKSAAAAVAKASDTEMTAFESKYPSISDDDRVLLDNWQHFDGDIESGTPDSCLS